ncbi:iron ABC transporter permease [candidate division KSB1 bacterium]|nr:iron ABC transporter permease [candidate division KSB1 bacterium]NIR70906.1 iron ABC transporter permease [candidate division KSB1 bacterium]NIS23078.1 iron ABC transporter permease [candidate division KSB1 bacterium]NIT69913.1 iron ABC transporter permease [candidate division KSB1 bacterium]NIU23579.1 iron ABC transporter permease [candidate division KSB1 bacterium]
MKFCADLKKRYFVLLPILIVFFFCTFSLAPTIGSAKIDLTRAFDFSLRFRENMDAQIFFIARLPRVILAALTGAALAVAGLVFQAVLKNPLATPYTLGIASGASLGAVISIRAGIVFMAFGLSSLTLSAFSGALLTVCLIYLMSKRKDYLPTAVMLLAGVALSFLFSALILFVHYLSDFTQSYQMLRWLMGGLDIIDYKLIVNILPAVLLSLVLLVSIAKELNLLSSGEELAASRGVNVGRTKKIAYFAASLMTAAVVSLSGPIGFIGLIIPHILRLLIGADNRLLMPAAIFFGAGFLIICDTIARTIIAPLEIPVGIITAILGCPFFIWLLLREKRRVVFKS